jgi:hypothetical protein
MKLAYGIIFISSSGTLAVKRNNLLPQLMPASSQWRKQFGLEHPAQPSRDNRQSGRSSSSHQPSNSISAAQQLGHSLISSTELFDNSIINSSEENNKFSMESKKEQQNNHENTAEVVRKSDASLIWRRTLAGHVAKVEDNKDIEGYFHVTDSITDALNYYFNFKDEQIKKNSSGNNRRRKRDTESNLKGEDFIDYGCWCNRVRYLKESGINDMSAMDNNYKGGKVVDEIDRVCQDWTKCMRCVTITNSRTFEEAQADQTTRNFQQSNCQFVKMTFAFGIKTTGELTCSDPSNHVRSCAYQTCMCNLDLIEKLSDLRHAFEATNSRFNKNHVQQCNYQLKGRQVTTLSEDEQMAESGLSIIGFEPSDPATRTANSAMASNNDEFLNDYWSFDYDNTKSEDTDYYDSAPVSVHGDSLNGPRASSKQNGQDNRERGETQCCGSVPSWRPYKTNNKQCCRRRTDSSESEGLQYWIAKKSDGACQAQPIHTLT